ncbi:hypothetical protein B0H17DRAFT_1214496 [Mycena rosella]|uniref:Uncharacterized protein n=1 Tax=Mycena rosella TaxID=1033263 RepID=A0AAD7G0S9_MYCRO|nr:hypothetical protein B0H17DRAFT_1214496 [Mycena rosella]
MVNTTKNAPVSAPKKKRSSGGLKKKPTAYNKYMSEELARLKSLNIEPHSERWTQATKSWTAAKTKSSSSSGSSP